MSHTERAAALACALTLATGCTGGEPAPTPKPSATGGGLLAVEDLPDGYATSPPEVEPEVSAVSSVSVAGCDVLLDRFRGGGAGAGSTARTVRFEGGSAGPFLAEEVAADAGTLPALRTLAARCAGFTDTDADGTTTTVTVAAADFPGLGDESVAFRMAASGGAGDDSYTLSGYLIVVRLGATTCTLVHFGQPEVDRAETEAIAKAAVRKLQHRQ